MKNYQDSALKLVLVAGCGMFLSTLDSGIINIAIPTLTKAFSSHIDTVIWTITSYTLILSASILAFGFIADIVGSLKVYALGLVFFAISSLLCGLSDSIDVLIVFRGLQGLSAAMIQATAMALITTRLEGYDLKKAMSLFAVILGMGPMLGPLLGGGILAFFGWSWIFWLNIPVCLFAIYGCCRLAKTQTAIHGRANIKQLLFEIGTFRKIDLFSPMLGIISFGGATAVTFMLPPLYFEKLRHFGIWQIGLISISAPLGLMLSARLSAKMTHRYHACIPMSIGLATMILSLLILSEIAKSWSVIFIFLVLTIYGVGGGLFQTPCYLSILSQFPSNRQAFIASLVRMVQNLAIASESAAGAYLITVAKGQDDALLAGIHRTWFMAAMITAAALSTLLLQMLKRRSHVFT
ncbi:MAG: MFS transporter [Francisellaceae bacterium]